MCPTDGVPGVVLRVARCLQKGPRVVALHTRILARATGVFTPNRSRVLAGAPQVIAAPHGTRVLAGPQVLDTDALISSFLIGGATPQAWVHAARVLALVASSC